MVGKFTYLAASTALALLPAMASAAESSGLEEIVVTARKVEENIQRVPISITAVTSKMIDDMSITNITQIDRLAPNLQYSAGPSGSSSAANFFIRGIGQVDFIATSDPGVSLYLDGVYVGRTVGAALDTADIERIEVLKGPQGTLFGKNSIGGAINVMTKRPSKEAGGYVEGTVGNLGRYDGKFVANTPISDTLFLKLSGVTRNNDGFAKRVLDDVKLGDDNDVSGRIQLLWEASEDVEIFLSADATRRRAHIAAHGNTAVAPSFCFGDPCGSVLFEQVTGSNVLDFGPSSDPQKINTTSVRPTDDLNVLGTSLEINWDMGFATLKSISAYRKVENDTAADFDGSLLQFNDQEITQNQDQYSQEFQLSGTTGRLEWIVGAYYLREEIFQDTLNFDLGVTSYPAGSPPTLGIVGVTRTIDLTSDSTALFGQASYHITDQLSVTAGARWTHDEKDVVLFSEIGTDGLPFTISSGTNWDNVSPHFGLEYQAAEDALLYVSATRGFKSGSFNGRPNLGSEAISYDPEKVWAYEAGLKSQWFGNRVRFNAAGFWTQYKSIQLITGALDTLGSLFFPVTNAGNVDIRGFEVELQARPVEDLDVFASLGYADEKWQKIFPTPFSTISTSTRLPSLAHWSAVVGGQYSIPLNNFGFVALGATYSYRSSYVQTTINSPNEVEDGYSLVDAHIILEPESGNWQFKFWGKNLTDSKYIVWGQDLIAIGNSHAAMWFGRPREYGATLRLSF